jgi:membrane protease subunit HflC
MRGFLASFALFAIVAAGVAAFFSLFIVNQTNTAIVLQFGEPVKVIREPGLYWRIPFVQTVEYFDRRIIDLQTEEQEVIASDQKRLVVDVFARYRIIDALKFYQAFRNETAARQRLTSIVDSTMRSVLGRTTFIDVVRNRRDALMKQTAQQVTEEVKNLGIEIVDVRIRRADLPEANSQAVYRRMQTERAREAAEIRAQGTEQAQRIRADADRQVTVLVAEANREAERLRGEGDAERNRIYAAAFGKDQDFFSFYRSMQSYEEALKSQGTRMVLTPNSEFFRYFNSPRGAGSPPAAPNGQATAQAAQPGQPAQR